MNTPIYDFVSAWLASDPARFHMPGHKGRSLLGCEDRDITEIAGADSLYEAAGIIAQSEENASALFGCPTFYSAEGSSLCVRTMVRLAALWAAERGRAPLILAARNVHKTFLSAAALLDVPVRWLWGKGSSLLSAPVDPEELEQALRELRPAAVYLTTPDYLGHLADVASVSALCRRYDALLLTDNAHGAYLRFLTPSRHPMDLGADLCCDSAHKTLPALTGAAWLHLRPDLPRSLLDRARESMALFGSTSPSYLILQSLDLTNPVLERLPQTLSAFLPRLEALKQRLTDRGFTLIGEEPLKLTLLTKPWGWTGTELAAYLTEQGIWPEFSDPDHLVLMPSPWNRPEELDRVERVLLDLPRRAPISRRPPRRTVPVRAMGPREAMRLPAERLPIEACSGRVLASPCVSCPPAVPILMCGEIIDQQAMAAFAYYGIRTLLVTRRESAAAT